MKFLQWFLRVLHMVVAFIGILALQALVIITFIHVVMRYGFDSGINWSEEVCSNILMPGFVFLGMALGVQEDIHINVTVLPKSTPKWIFALTERLKDLCFIIIGIMMCYYSYNLILLNIEFENILPATELNNALQYVSMPVAGAMLAIVAFFALFNIKLTKNLVVRICAMDE